MSAGGIEARACELFGQCGQVRKAGARRNRFEAQAIEITIDDEGPGIPADELARPFQPFYRV
jgi:signal transduction histidine kinase